MGIAFQQVVKRCWRRSVFGRAVAKTGRAFPEGVSVSAPCDRTPPRPTTEVNPEDSDVARQASRKPFLRFLRFLRRHPAVRRLRAPANRRRPLGTRYGLCRPRPLRHLSRNGKPALAGLAPRPL